MASWNEIILSILLSFQIVYFLLRYVFHFIGADLLDNEDSSREGESVSFLKDVRNSFDAIIFAFSIIVCLIESFNDGSSRINLKEIGFSLVTLRLISSYHRIRCEKRVDSKSFYAFKIFSPVLLDLFLLNIVVFTSFSFAGHLLFFNSSDSSLLLFTHPFESRYISMLSMFQVLTTSNWQSKFF